MSTHSPSSESAQKSHERPIGTTSGWFVLMILVGLMAILVGAIVLGIQTKAPLLIALPALGLIFITVLTIFGFFTLQPNQAVVLILFGAYKGSVRQSGFHWTNPFYSKRKISLRAHNLNGERLKVNDLRGNPIEIAAVVVWRVADTAQATFDVEDFTEFVDVQSESAVRDLARTYAYDIGQDTEGGHEELTLRDGGKEVAIRLQKELEERVEKAGVRIEEARVSHLAYAPEIASAMLKRQQAEAIISARRKIVDGAVSMVEHALEELAEKEVLDLDNERKAAMVSNLLVILCGDREATPVVNTGTIYS